MYKGLRGYWRRRGYKKLSGSGRRHKNRMELPSPRKRRVWRIKMSPKLKLSCLRRIPSPKKFLVWLRDAYVQLMLRFANSRVFTTAYGGSVCHGATGSFGKGPLKEYDEKMIIEIYRSLMLAQDLMHASKPCQKGQRHSIIKRRGSSAPSTCDVLPHSIIIKDSYTLQKCSRCLHCETVPRFLTNLQSASSSIGPSLQSAPSSIGPSLRCFGRSAIPTSQRRRRSPQIQRLPRPLLSDQSSSARYSEASPIQLVELLEAECIYLQSSTD